MVGCLATTIHVDSNKVEPRLRKGLIRRWNFGVGSHTAGPSSHSFDTSLSARDAPVSDNFEAFGFQQLMPLLAAKLISR